MAIGIIGKVDYIKYRPISIPKTMIQMDLVIIPVLHVALFSIKIIGIIVFVLKLRFRCAALEFFSAIQNSR